MRDTGTSSAQTAGCGEKSSKGYRLKQDYWLHRVAGDIQQGYCFRELPAPECCRFRSVTGSGVLPVPEYCWLQRNLLYPLLIQCWQQVCRNRNAAGSGTGVLLVTRILQIQCWHQVQQLQRFLPGAAPILWLQSLLPEPTGLTGYRAAEPTLWTGRRQPHMSLSLLRSSSPSSANPGEFMQNCGATRNRLQSCWTTTVGRKKATSYEPIPAKK